MGIFFAGDIPEMLGAAVLAHFYKRKSRHSLYLPSCGRQDAAAAGAKGGGSIPFIVNSPIPLKFRAMRRNAKQGSQ